MSQQPSISLFVKLGYWDVYRLNVVLTATAFRKILYIWGFVALLWLSVSVLLLIRPSSAHDWAVTQQNAKPLTWAFALPVIFVFVLPLLSAQRVLRDELRLGQVPQAPGLEVRRFAVFAAILAGL